MQPLRALSPHAPQPGDKGPLLVRLRRVPEVLHVAHLSLPSLFRETRRLTSPTSRSLLSPVAERVVFSFVSVIFPSLPLLSAVRL